MTENNINIPCEPDPIDTAPLKKDMRRAFSRCGWAVFAVAGFVTAASLMLGVIIRLTGAEASTLYTLYQQYLLLFNEAAVAISILLGFLVLARMPKSPPEKAKTSPGFFITLLCICFTVGIAGNLIGNAWLMIWNTVTGKQVTNQLTEIMTTLSPRQVALCTGILAPILEELFFRKLLIDRMYKYGELTAILTSAIFFGLIHQNFSQFFYAFGLGIVIGYLYCKTRSYLAVTLLHMAFNMIMGVLPALLTPKVLQYAEAIETGTEAEMMAILGEYILPLMLYLLYVLAIGILTIVGLILLLVNYKKITINKNNPDLPAADKRKAALLNSGTIAAAVILVGLMIASLFTA